MFLRSTLTPYWLLVPDLDRRQDSVPGHPRVRSGTIRDSRHDLEHDPDTPRVPDLEDHR